MRRGSLLLLVVVALAALPSVPVRAQPAPPTILIYGDSLVHEADPYLRLLLRDHGGGTPMIHASPGGAVCDVLPSMREDARKFRPVAVILAFSGNAITPCMRKDGVPYRGQEWLAKYHRDLVEAISIFRAGSPTIWLGTFPTSYLAQKRGSNDQAAMNFLAGVLSASNRRVRVADSGAALLIKGEWTRTMHCLPKEPCEGGIDAQLNGVNIVRNYDTAHFCPTPLSLGGTCPVHSSGAMRYAVGLLRPALVALGRWDQRTADRSIVAGWPGEAGR